MAGTTGVRPVGVHGAGPAALEAKSKVLWVVAGVWDGDGEEKRGAAHLLPLQEEDKATFIFPLILLIPVPLDSRSEGLPQHSSAQTAGLPVSLRGSQRLSRPTGLKGCVPLCPPRPTSIYVLEIPFPLQMDPLFSPLRAQSCWDIAWPHLS